MARRFILICLFLECCVGADAAVNAPQMPFAFVENRGQADARVRYIGSGPDFKAWFHATGVVFQQGEAVARVEFAGSERGVAIDAIEPTGATANYIRGGDPKQWKTNLPFFGALRYRGVWPGVEIDFKTNGSEAKAEYVVAPGFSSAEIRLRFDGDAEIQADGSLLVSGATGQFREQKPFLFQDLASGRRAVEGGFRKYDDGTIGFTTGPYDRKQPLVIDPVLLFSGYFGGVSQTNITSLAINSSYNIIVAGWSTATDLPASNGARTRTGGGVDAFVAGFSPSGGSLLFCTYLGGSSDDRAFGLAVDAAANTYVTGWTSSTNFPVLGGVQAKLSGSRDAFVAKLNPSGNALIYSTYLGGSGVDTGNGIALDTNNSAVIVGDTTSTNLATTPGVLQRRTAGSQDTFVAKLTPSGSGITFMTYFGGSASEHGAAIQVDSSNTVFIGGSTYSTNLPTSHAFQPQSGGGQDAFFTRLSADASAILFSTYIGGSNGQPGAPEELTAISLGPLGNPTVAGTTSSVDFPASATAFQSTFGGGQTDGFIARFTASTGGLVKATFLGGSLNDGINGLAIDYRGDMYVAGYTSSTDFPAQRPIQSSNAGGMDAFVAKLTFVSVEFATYLGGQGNDSANAIAVDALTSVVVAGSTGSSNFPTAGKVGGWSGGVLSSFLTKLAPNFTTGIAAVPFINLDPWHTTGYNGSSSTLRQMNFGQAGDVPVMGDWDGSGLKRPGVFRNGTWLLDLNNDGVYDSGDKIVSFGQTGDIPVVGDWTGTGTLKLGLFRQGSFILDLSGHLSGIATGQNDAFFSFGASTDKPVVGDWNLSGTTKVGVFRNGTWLLDYNGDRVFDSLDRTYYYGQAGDVPVVGDWDSSGSTRLGVYRNGSWILDYHSEGQATGAILYPLLFTFGSSAYTPLVW
jgi:hypothetical protein